MKKIIYVAILLMVLSSCTSIDKEFDGRFSLRDNHISRFYATTEQNNQETKVYADEDLKVLWNAGDLLSVFNQRTYNSKFEFKGEEGDNAGDFEDVTPSGLHSGNALDNVYAVYPYASGNKINNAGNTITLTLPAEQQYKAHSFGIGANTMVAVTDDSYLAFKNLCGYLQLRLYGDNVSVSSITIQGNNGEKIAGKANVAVGLGALPTVTMDDTATDAITLVCDPPVEIGATADNYTDFWFVIPPTTFSGGFTITVTDELGGVYEKSTTKSLIIARSTMEWMSALQVTPNYDNVNVVFEDANFKAYCVGRYDTDGDGEISMTEAKEVTEINVKTDNITSLQGVEYFTNVIKIICKGSGWAYVEGEPVNQGKLINLDVSHNTALTWLECGYNQLTSLDVSHNRALIWLDCRENQLTSLDVSNNTELSFLQCYDNKLTSLDVSHNTALTGLELSGNQLTSLDVSNNTALTRLVCGVNQLTGLDVSHNTALTALACMDSQLTSLDVSHNTALTSLQCSNNQLTSLDVSNNTALAYLDCNNIQLTSLDLSHNTALTQLMCHNNQLTSLDVSNNTALTYLSCGNNQLTSLDLSHNTALTQLLCYGNQLTGLDVSNNTALTYLSCRGNQLTSLDVSHNTALTSLYCGINQLTVLDVSNNTALKTLDCASMNSLQYLYIANGQTIPRITENRNSNYIPATTEIVDITDNVVFADANFKTYCVENFDTNHNGEISYSEALDVTSISCHSKNIQSLTGIEHFKNLTYLNCDGNQLTSLDVSKNTALTGLNCRHNQLSSIDVSINTALDSLLCSSNQLTSLDVSNNTALVLMDCGSNQLTSLDVSNNTALVRLYCGYNQLTSLDVSKNTALTYLSCGNNQLTSLDVSKNTRLRYLYCNVNQLTSLDVSKNIALKLLVCGDNQLSTLDVSNNTALNYLDCLNNPLLTEIWLKTGQVINNFYYDTSVATIKYKD